MGCLIRIILLVVLMRQFRLEEENEMTRKSRREFIMNSYDKLALALGRAFLATVAVAFTACLTLLGYGSLQVASEALGSEKAPVAEELTYTPIRYGFPVESVSFIPNTFPVRVATPVIKEVQLPQLAIKVEKRSGVRGVLAIKLPAKVEAMVASVEVSETVANPLPNIPEWGLIEEATGISIDKAASLDTDLNPAANELIETINHGTYLGAVEAELEI